PTRRPPAPPTPRGPADAARVARRPLAATLAAAPDLAERLKRLDAALAHRTSGARLRLLEALLDAPLPGDAYEAGELRLALLARIGRLPGERATAALARRLRPEAPRPERLLALELLAARGAATGGRLVAMATSDHDRVVRARARSVLARGGSQ
ncbi:MAG: hypothetical protein D6731_22275, partial [Planctomycetota bacterium]